MLRRAAPLVRSLRSTTTVVQSSTSASNGQNIVVNANRGGYGRGDNRRGGFQSRAQRNPFQLQQSHMDEHTQLMKKHGDTVEKKDIQSLSDAVERINWYSTVSRMTVDKVAKMMMKASIEELNGISDRSMATLISSFGELCKEMKRDDKKELLEKIVKEISHKGYTLGPFTRASIFTTKVDNYQTVEELPSIVDELSAWESDGINPTEDLIVQAARVYAIQGDRKGVIELTNYARETFGRVEVRFLEWLAYSMISCGESNGMIAIEKLSRSAPDSSSRIWLNGALAAANKANLEMAVECLSRVPLSSGLSHSDKNGPVVDILIQLIEREVEGAEQALSGYLSLAGEGSTLHERHPYNSIVVFKARRAVYERKMDVATRLYALAHDMQKNKMVESDLKRGVEEMGSKGNKSVEEMARCAIRLEQSGVIEDANAFLLNSLEGEKLMEFIEHLRSTDELSDAVSKSNLNKFALASRLIKTCSSSASSPLSITPSVTAILCQTGGSNSFKSFNEERLDIERMIFRSAQENPEVVRKVIDELAESKMADAESLGGNIITAALSRIAYEDDVLTSGRIEKIISSGNIPWIRLSSLENKLVRIIRLGEKKEELVDKALEIVAGIIIAAFKTEGRKDNQMASLINLIGNTYINDDNIEKLVRTLNREPVVGINQNFMERAVKEFEERGLKKRVELIGLLQKQSQAYIRWLASTPDDLEKELNGIEKNKGVHSGVLFTIKTILMEKLIDTKPVSTDRLIPLLEKVIPTLNKKVQLKEGEEKQPWENARRTRLIDSTGKVFGKAMRQCIVEGNWSGATRLWAMRGDLRYIPIAPSLALSFHEGKEGSKELSEDILSTIRSNGQSVSHVDLSELGELLSDLSLEELSSVEEWLKKELRLEERLVTRIKSARVKRGMTEMIENGRLDEAFELMKDASEKANNAIGHFDLLRAAIRIESPLFGPIFNLVASLHSKASAMLDVAYLFLMEKNREKGELLFKNSTLKLSEKKLIFYVTNSIKEDRIDVIHALFSILVSCPLSEEKLSNGSLNYLASSTLRGYLKNNEMERAKEVIEEIEGSTLVIESQLQSIINRVKKISRS